MAKKKDPLSAEAQGKVRNPRGETMQETYDKLKQDQEEVAEDGAVEVQEVDGETGEPEQRAAPTWTKVVLISGGMGTSVGLQDEGCDPALQLLGGVGLDEALGRVPELLQQCRESWQERPKYEEYQRPPEPERPTPPARTGARPAASTAKAKQPAAQQSLF